MVKLEEILKQFHGQGHTWVNVRINRPVKVLQGHPEYRKVTEGVYGLNSNYEQNVNARRIKEGKEADFVSEPPKGKKWDVFPYTLYKEKDANVHYLRLYVTHNTEPNVIYTDATGKRVSIEEVKQHAQAIEFREKPKNESQGLEKPLILFDVNAENLEAVWVGDKKVGN